MAHAQRSTHVSADRSGAVFHCHEGKTRQRKGKTSSPAAPFDWFVPEVVDRGGLFPHRLVERFVGRLRRLSAKRGKEISFIFPRLAPEGAPILKATSFKLVSMHPATLNRLLFLLSGPTRPKEPSAHDGSPITVRALRKLGPITADAFVLCLRERLPLGTARRRTFEDGSGNSPLCSDAAHLSA